MSKNIGRDYNMHILSYLHWNYIYTNAHYYSKSHIIKNINEYIYNLRDLITISHENLESLMLVIFLKTIKNIVRKEHGNKFDIYYSEINSYFSCYELTELKSMYKLYKIMINNIYFPWHFLCKPLGYLMLKNFDNKKFYMNPRPHYYTNESYLLQLSSISKEDSFCFDDGDAFHLFEDIDFNFSIDAHADEFSCEDEEKKFAIEIRAVSIIRNILRNSIINNDEISVYNKLISKYNKFSFDSSSNFSRSVGFYLWEKIYFSKNRYNEKNVLDWFYKTNIYTKLNNKVKDRKKEYLGDKDEKILLKWLKKTDQCIKNKCVLSFK